MKILITGANGFAGQHLLNYLAGEEKLLRDSFPSLKNEPVKEFTGIDITTGKISGNFFNFINADLRDREKVFDLVSKLKPDRVYHLAAQSSVRCSWQKPVETLEINLLGSINLLEAVKAFCPECRVLITCTAEEYGNSSGLVEAPLKEDSRINPRNPYAISKAALDFFAVIFQEVNHLSIMISRSFNHIGPGQSDTFVISDFAHQIALIEKGLKEPVVLAGNIENYRDFLDVRDVVKAYVSIMEKGEAGEAYNVCSGTKSKISEMLGYLIDLSTAQKIKVLIDKGKFRPSDLEVIYGDYSKLKEKTGWGPSYNIKQSLQDILNWWRERVN